MENLNQIMDALMSHSDTWQLFVLLLYEDHGHEKRVYQVCGMGTIGASNYGFFVCKYCDRGGTHTSR